MFWGCMGWLGTGHGTKIEALLTKEVYVDFGGQIPAEPGAFRDGTDKIMELSVLSGQQILPTKTPLRSMGGAQEAPWQV
ncbi:hypothetical protein RhiXN_10414 [Rhizoctonia solani]|uniref:Uncharacterized protein n=1 Tax=Rhizoctonia solani TaxID=456999 RepID=A0A8H8P433_9AGAM|nr:uncharacterized protein RhiXN_10414 [Rhizoctonia solani]QRW24090.1 hypothetical protein RhiXN_10414 [Rhizoctonia solani]